MKKYGCYFVALMGATALTPQMALAQDITSESDESHATDTGLERFSTALSRHGIPVG